MGREETLNGGNREPGKRSKVHQCIRKAVVLNYDDHFDTWEARPCIDFEKLDPKEQKHFEWCSRILHHLKYHPDKGFKFCSNMMSAFRRYVWDYGISIILYKGGLIEAEIADK